MTKIKINWIIFITLALIATKTSAAEFHHKCHHAVKQSKIEIKTMEMPSERVLQTNPVTDHKIRIKFDYSRKPDNTNPMQLWTLLSVETQP